MQNWVSLYLFSWVMNTEFLSDAKPFFFSSYVLSSKLIYTANLRLLSETVEARYGEPSVESNVSKTYKAKMAKYHWWPKYLAIYHCWLKYLAMYRCLELEFVKLEFLELKSYFSKELKLHKKLVVIFHVTQVS